MTPSQVVISHALLEKWDAELKAAEAAIRAHIAKLDVLKQRNDAARVLLSQLGNASDKTPNAFALEPEPESTETQTLTAAIEKLVNESAKPVPKSEARAKLVKLGFPIDQSPNYFYTAVMRLRKKRKISVLPNGDLARAAA